MLKQYTLQHIPLDKYHMRIKCKSQNVKIIFQSFRSEYVPDADYIVEIKALGARLLYFLYALRFEKS